MKELVKVIGLVMLALLCWAGPAEGKKKNDDRTDFIRGVDYGKSYLKPGTKKGDRYHRGLQKMHDTWGPWLWQYAKYEYVPFTSRCWLESRGNPWSHTKDEVLGEAGLTSATYADAVSICEEWGLCGDPCGDPQLSIAISAYRRYRQHMNMLHATKPDGEPTYWSARLPQQCEDNYYECRAFMGACGSMNCTKVKRMVKAADGANGVWSTPGKDGKLHAWWGMMNYLRGASQEKILSILSPLPKSKSVYLLGTKVGRVMSGQNKRAVHHEPLPSNNGAKPEKNYCWIEEPWYPHVEVVVVGVDGEAETKLVPVFPEPLVPWPVGKDGKVKVPKKSEWRDRCTFYGNKKAWKKSWGGPKKKDKYKTTGCVTKDGVQKCWKKGLKYPTEEAWQEAYDAWFDLQQAEGRLPTDEEYASWEADMALAGCAYRRVVEDKPDGK